MSTSDSSPILRKPSRWRRWLRRLGLSLLVLLVGLGIRQWVHHIRVSEALAKALSELDESDPGWRLEEIEAAREVVPDEENSARVILAAHEHLPRNWTISVWKVTEIGKELPPARQLSIPDIAQLDKELQARRQALAAAARLSEMPRGRYPITYLRNAIETRLDDQVKARSIVALLRMQTLRQAKSNEPKKALENCRSILNAARSYGDEPMSITQLLCVSLTVIACQAGERVLAQTEPAPEDLELLQRAILLEDRHHGEVFAARGERALWHAMFDALEAGDVTAGQLADARVAPTWWERIYGPVIRDRFRDAHPLMLQFMHKHVERVTLPMHEQAPLERELEQEVKALSSYKGTLVRLLIPSFVKLGEAFRRKHACVRSLAALIACERFRVEHGRWPARLKELTPKLLSEVPLDPYDGKPMRYKKLPDGVIVYSVGADATDNGGNIDRTKTPTTPGTDLGFQLWDVNHRRQLPAPEKAP